MQPNFEPVAGQEAISAEQGYLGTLLMFPQSLPQIRDTLGDDFFVDAIHSRIYSTMLEMADEGNQLSAPALLARIGNIDMRPGHKDLRAYLHALAMNASPVASLPGNAKAIADAHGMRQLQEILDELQYELAEGGIKPPGPIAIKLINKLDAIACEGMGETVKPMELGRASKLALEQAINAREAGESPGIMTQLPSLDRMLNGFRPGQLIVLGGRPAMGKTALALKIALAAAGQGVATMMASLEMPAIDLGERALSAQAYKDGHVIPYERIAAAMELTDAEIDILYDAEEHLSQLPFFIEQRSGLSVQQLCAAARRYLAQQREKGLARGILVVDYLSLVRASDRYKGNRVSEVGEVTRALKAFAKEQGIPVLLLAQLNRGVENREDKRPIMADLRESGEIEQDADTILFVYREEYYLQQVSVDGLPHDEQDEHMAKLSAAMNVLEIIVAKQRKGRTGKVAAMVDLRCNIVDELSRY